MSIAIEFPVHPARTPALVDRLNEVVLAEGGRIYLTKDAFTRPEHFRAMEPRLDAFNAVRRQWDPQVRIRSAQSVRLLGDPA
jgi:FAD/FMN-containing dehydrogenase